MNHFRVTLQYSTMSNSEAIDLTASQPEVTSDLHILIPLSILNILRVSTFASLKKGLNYTIRDILSILKAGIGQSGEILGF